MNKGCFRGRREVSYCTWFLPKLADWLAIAHYANNCKALLPTAISNQRITQAANKFLGRALAGLLLHQEHNSFARKLFFLPYLLAVETAFENLLLYLGY